MNPCRIIAHRIGVSAGCVVSSVSSASGPTLRGDRDTGEYSGRFFSFAVLDTLDVLERRHDIVAPITDQLVSYCPENALLVALEEPKIEDLRAELDFPDHRMYNRLRQLEEAGRIAVDRSGRLNTYQRTT